MIGERASTTAVDAAASARPDETPVDTARLAAVVSPLRRALLSSARAREGLPDIPDAQIEILRALPRGTVRTPGGLADSLGVGRSTVSNLLTTMERRGLVARRPRDDDRRHVEVLATGEALTLFERFDKAAAAIVADALADLSFEDRRRIQSALPALERLRDAVVAVRRAAASTTASPQEDR